MPAKQSNYSQAITQITVDLACQKAWELLRDLSLAHNYVPGVVDTQITTPQREGVGASRRVYQNKTRFINETVEEWIDGHGFLIRLHCGDAGPPFPFQEAWFRYSIEANGDYTVLTTSLIYTIRWRTIGRILDWLLFHPIIRSRIRSVAIGLKNFWETGKPVERI